jgi:hypothetical protein
VKNFAAGGHAIGTRDAAPPASLCAFEGVIAKTADWRGLGRVAGASSSQPAI